MSIIGDSNSTNANDEALVSELSNAGAIQAVVNPTPSVGLTAYANTNNTVGGNLQDRKTLRINNLGKKILWRFDGELSAGVGEIISKNEIVEFYYGENLVIVLEEANNLNEIDVIITETR